MTLTGATLANYDEALKTFYLPAVTEQLNHEIPLEDLIDKNERDVSGKNATIECHYGRSTGTGARADGGALPTAGYQKHKTATVPMKYLYGRIEVSGPTIAATRDEKGAYAKALDREIVGIVQDIKKEVNRMLWGAGYGTLARWRSGTTTSMTLQRKYMGNSVGGDGFGSTFGAKYLKERGDAVPVVLTVASSVITVATVDGTSIAVSAVTEDKVNGYDTITCTDADVTEAAGTFYVRPASLVTYNASSAAGAARLEMMGLRGIVTDTDLDNITLNDGVDTGITTPADPLQGLAVATYAWWKAHVDSHPSGRYAGQRALTLNLMQKMFDNVETAAGMGQGPNLIMASKAIRREYIELCQAANRTINEKQLDGGWSAVMYSGGGGAVPILVDDDAIDGEMYFLTTSDLQIYRMADWDWMQKDGAILSRITGFDAYEAVLFRYSELGTTRRNTQGVLTDLQYTE